MQKAGSARRVYTRFGVLRCGNFSQQLQILSVGDICSMKNNHMTQERKSWTNEEIWTLKSMATKHPPAEIASKLGRGLASVRAKAYELSISLRMKRRKRQTDPEPRD
jgi:hypothetical protein